MATTLTADGELTFCSFPITKTETTADGDLIVYGKATDGSVDADRQIVKPSFAYQAIKQWQETGANVRVQHNPQRDPAGVGIGVDFDGDATWVKALVVEPVAKTLVSKGALRAYSVGIARPTIERDITGKAQGGIITAGQIVEISLVDRPANKSCGIQLVKNDTGYETKVFGDEEVIAKFTGGQVLGKSIEGAPENIPNPTMHDISIDFTPNDLMKILQNKLVEKHYDELASTALFEAEAAVYKRDVDTAERRSLASAGNALPDGSYPIANSGDLHNAAHLASTGHGNAEAAKRLIARRAHELGVANPLESNDSEKESISVTDPVTAEVVKDDANKEAEPVITKEPVEGETADKPKAEKGKKAKGGKKMPPWMNQDDAQADSPGNTKADDGDECKVEHAHTEKCAPKGTPQSASGAKDAPPMSEIPDPNAFVESPMPAGRKDPDISPMGKQHSSPETAAMLRFKSVGIDTDMGRIHDLTCPAYSPEEVAKYHPFADLSSVIDEGVWMRKAVDAATGPLEVAKNLTEVWQAVQILKSADPAEVNDFRLQLHKAFRDANPGPTSYPSPGAMSPSKFNRGVITAGHASNGNGYDGPNSSPVVASGMPSASHFDSPPLSAGHQTPSPSFMKNEHEYPTEQGVPVHLSYAHIEKEKVRAALTTVHDHLQHQFPSVCPVLDQDPYRVNQVKPVPEPAGIGKAEGAENPEVVKAEVDELEAIITKGRKKMLKKLGKKVMAGKLSLDEARTQVGNRMSRKAEDEVTEMVSKGMVSIEQVRAMLGMPTEVAKSETPEEVITKGVTYQPDLIKSAMSEALAPLMEQITAQQELLTKAEQKISEQEARWEAAANLPDPKTASFSGLALNMVPKTSRPVAIKSQAEIAERTQHMIRQQLQHTWRTSENSAEREAAWAELQKYAE